MTKPELVKIIMEQTDNYKKTHLMVKRKDELEMIASGFTLENTFATISELETAKHINIPDERKAVHTAIIQAVEAIFDERLKDDNYKRINKDELRAMVIETAAARIEGAAAAEKPSEVVPKILDELLCDKTAFCTINDTEKLMLSTIPKLPDFTGLDSVMDGKGFLAKVQELHGVSANISKALMVSLMRKRFYQIIGKKSGQKKTTIKLLSRGKRYLLDNGLCAEV